MTKEKFEGCWNFNQQSDLSNGVPMEGRSSDSMYGCLLKQIQFDGSLDKLKFIIVVRGDLQNKEIIGYTWYPTASMRAMKYLLSYYSKQK